MAHALLDTAAQPRFADGSLAHSFPTDASGAPAPADSAWPMDPAIGYELGRDYARHGLIPPPEQLRAGNPVRQGWEAGRQRRLRLAVVGRDSRDGRGATGANGAAVVNGSNPARLSSRSTSPATPALSLLLQARLQAWLHGQTFELMSISPHLIGQLRVSHCPVTRAPLRWPGDSSASGPAARGRALTAIPHRPLAGEGAPQGRERAHAIDAHAEPAQLCRLTPQAAYAAGNLAVMSRQGEAAHGLGPAEQARRAVLTSFVTALPHDEAASLPLLVLPPNRVRLLNPIQALQALLTLQLARSGWSKRLPQLESLLATVGLTQPEFLSKVRGDLRSFFYTLMSRSIAAGRPGQRPTDQQAWRWALEDAWAQPQVLLAWQRLARQLSPAQAEALVQRAAEAGLCTQHVQVLSLEQATDGWALAPLASSFEPLATLGFAVGSANPQDYSAPSCVGGSAAAAASASGGNSAPARGVAAPLHAAGLPPTQQLALPM